MQRMHHPSRRLQSSARAALLIAEAKRRKKDPVAELRKVAFPNQLAFIDDPCRHKAACCTRRAGKTYGVGIYVLIEALTHPKSNILYLALTREAAKRIVLKDVFKDLNDRLQLGIQFNLAELTMTFPNGSVVYISGADVNERQHAKFEGGKYRLVVIDESQHWKTDLYGLLEASLWPAMNDVLGTIVMIGVPDDAHAFFYDVTTRQVDPKSGRVKHPGWSVHSWSALDNPHQAKNWQLDLDAKLLEDPLFVETATYQQRWLGRWVVDPDAQCYRFQDDRNRVPELPGNVDDFTWYLGVDVGWKPDPMAFVVCGHRKDNSDGTLYVVHAFKRTEMNVDEVKGHVDGLLRRWPIDTFVVDGANGNFVAELVQRTGIPFEKAQKHGDSQHQKRNYISLMSDELKMAHVKVVGDAADDLVDEWKGLVWDKADPTRPREHSAMPNHCADAALYAWRRAFHYVKPLARAPRVDRDLPEWAEHREQLLLERARQAYQGDPSFEAWLR